MGHRLQLGHLSGTVLLQTVDDSRVEDVGGGVDGDGRLLLNVIKTFPPLGVFVEVAAVVGDVQLAGCQAHPVERVGIGYRGVGTETVYVGQLGAAVECFLPHHVEGCGQRQFLEHVAV